jgi:hypothetical protein
MTPLPSSDNEPAICLGGCGRKLTSRLSKRRQMGRNCWRKFHGTPPHIATPASGQIPGQTALDLQPRQVTLWSP